MKIELIFLFEISLCMWRNTFTCDIVGKKGSIHISSLTKWDRTNFTIEKEFFHLANQKKKNIQLK